MRLSFVMSHELSVLNNYDYKDLEDLIAATFEFLGNGCTHKSCPPATRKPDTDPQITTDLVVEKLANLFLYASKLDVSELDFITCLNATIHDRGKCLLMWEAILNRKEQLQHLFTRYREAYLHYNKLDWRMECKLSKRAVRDEKKVDFLMCLDCHNGDRIRQKFSYTTDIANLTHMTEVLVSALHEAKSGHGETVKPS